MAKFIKNKWKKMAASAKIAILFVTALICLAGLTFFITFAKASSSSNDNQHQSETFPTEYAAFFGIDPADTQSDPDGDGLTNLEESRLGTDPLAADTDGDLWPDSLDDAVSRFYVPWGNETFTKNDDVQYVWPDFAVSSFRSGGNWGTTEDGRPCWYLSDDQNEASLNLEIDRNILQEDAVLQLSLFDHEKNSYLYIDLYDYEGQTIVENLAGNLLIGIGEPTTVIMNIPLSQYPDAVGVRIRGSGVLTILESLLYIDQDLDLLDDGQEWRLGTSDLMLNNYVDIFAGTSTDSEHSSAASSNAGPKPGTKAVSVQSKGKGGGKQDKKGGVHVMNLQGGGGGGTEQWQYKMKVSLTGYTKSEALTNFPALIVLGTNLMGFSYSQFASTNGWDLRFQNSDETVELNYETESWAIGGTGGSSYVWVQVPAVSGTNTSIWAYWGNSYVTSSPAIYTTNGSTWSAGYSGVWHIASSSGTNAYDSTSAKRTGYMRNISDSGWQAGLVANSFAFDGVNDFMSVPWRPPTNNCTTEFWLKTTNTAVRGFHDATLTEASGYGDRITYHNMGNVTVQIDNESISSSGATITNGQWRHVVHVFGSQINGQRLYVDGVLKASGSKKTVDPNQNSNYEEFGWDNVGSYYFQGMMDEIRVSAVTRSGDWLWACFMNQGSNGVFNTYGSVQTMGPTLPTINNDGGASNVTTTTATLNGNLTSTGGAPTTVYVYYGLSDGGTNKAAWGNTNSLGVKAEGLVTNAVSGLSAETAYYYRFYATNSAGGAWAASTTNFTTLSYPASTNEVRASQSSDDAEEYTNGVVSLTSSDLEMVNDLQLSQTNQTIGIRFTSIGVPKNATITSAYIQFKVDEADSTNTTLIFQGQAADNAGTFSTNTSDISSRSKTTASITWTNVPIWANEGDAGTDQRTPDLSSIAQEIVNRSGWSYGNAMVFVIIGTGKRTAESYDGDTNGCPLLHIEYTTGGQAAIPSISNDGGASNITPSSATLNGNLMYTGGAPTTVYVYWGLSDGGTNKAVWGNTNSLGVKVEGLVTNAVSGLAGATTYYYRFYATNSAGDAWASSTTNFTTLSCLPSIANAAASDITANSATLNGNLTYTGAAPTTAYVYWGTSDAGTNKAAWGHTNTFGVVSAGALSTNVTGLPASATHYYRFYATNQYGDAWASSTTNFATGASDFLTFNSKYVTNSSTEVTTYSTALVDDTQASNTFSLAADKTVFVIYSAHNINGAAEPGAGKEIAISIDGTDSAITWNSTYTSGRCNGLSTFWIGTLGAGSHTIKGRFAAYAVTPVTISERTLLVYVLNGDQFRYLDVAATNTMSSTVFTNDTNASLTFTNSGSCKALVMYNTGVPISDPGDVDINGKKIAINIGGTDYSQSQHAPGNATYANQVLTVHYMNLGAVSTNTVTGRFANQLGVSYSVSIARRQLGVLLFDDSALADYVASGTQVSTTSNYPQDDSQATIDRATSDNRELLVVAMGTKAYGTSSSTYGEAYGIKVNSNDRTKARSAGGSGDTPQNCPNSVSTVWAETLLPGNHAIQGRFGNNYSTETAKIDSRRVVALWLVAAPSTNAPTITNDGGASDVTATAATLNGNLIATGGVPTTVYCFWGTSDGGAAWGAWQFTNNLGVNPAGPLSASLTGLTSQTAYFYRFYATNSAGDAWASSTTNFATSSSAGANIYKMKIIFSAYDKNETLTNFPALVVFNAGITNFSYSQFTSPDGHDLRFASSNETETLNYEVEKWNSSGSSYVWVQVPLLQSSNDYIWAMWGDPTNTTQQPYTTNGATWSSGYSGVWHIASSSGTNAYDSTSAKRTGYMRNISDSGWQAGLVANSFAFDGVNDFMSVPWRPPTNNCTTEFWLKTTNTAVRGFHDATLTEASGYGDRITYHNLGDVVVQIDNESISSSGTSITNGQWRYFTHVFGAAINGQRLYIDGVLKASGSKKTVDPSQNSNYEEFGWDNVGSYYFQGMMDEIRVSAVTRSSNWLWACWLNMTSNSVFNGYGSVEETGTVQTASISGVISYAGPQSGQIYAVAVSSSESWAKDYYTSIAATGAYTIADVPRNANYWIKAWRDSDADGGKDTGEAYGSYTSNPVHLTNDISQINITLNDPDDDYDGIPDWWEVQIVNASANDNITEIQHVLPGGDWDADNVNNSNEWAFGTNPTNAVSHPPLLSFESVGSVVTKTNINKDVTIRLTLLPAATEEVSVWVTVTGGTARAGTDYTFTGQTVTFNAGDTNKDVTFTVLPDQELGPEPPKNAVLALSQLNGTALYGANNGHNVLIGDWAADSDGDGMPNWWEQQYFGGPTNALPNEDMEPDSWNNLEEYLRGTNPNVANADDTSNELQLLTLTPLRGN